MRKYSFYQQHPVPLNLTEIGGFDVLGMPEVPCFHQNGGRFEVKCSVGMADVLKIFEGRREVPEQFRGREMVADIRAEKTHAAVEELRLLVCNEFEKQMKIIADYRSYFYIPKERIVQYVSLPVSLFTLSPGNTSISFSVFTERFLGEVEDA